MAELIAEGMMGENHDFTWKFTNDGTLTISGSGVLKYSELPSEWDEEIANHEKFLRIVFEEGITEIDADMYLYNCPQPRILELPSSLYYLNGCIVRKPIVLFFHSNLPPRGSFIDANIVYVPFEAVDTYKAQGAWETIMAMPPRFSESSIVALYDTNFLRTSSGTNIDILVYTIDGALVLNRYMNYQSPSQLIKKAGDYVVVAGGKHQRIKVLADYVELEKNA